MKFSRTELLAVVLTMTVSLCSFADTIPPSDSLQPSGRQNYQDFPYPLTRRAANKKRMALKTNLLPWAASVMNAGLEVCLSDKVSVSVPVLWCPWFIGETKALRVLAFQPECRWWLGNAGKGHYVGPHLSLAWYNLKHGKFRYQDKGQPLVGVGLSYGYALRIKDNWGFEFSAGCGYVVLRYERYYNVDNGKLADTRKTSYFGIDHIGASLIYNFNL